MNFSDAAMIAAKDRSGDEKPSSGPLYEMPETIHVFRDGGVVEVNFAEWVAPDPVADNRLSRAMAAKSYFQWLCDRRVERACRVATRATLAHRPKGTGKPYWNWVGRREDAANSDSRVSRAASVANKVGGLVGELSKDFLFSIFRSYLADRHAGIKARANERFEAKKRLRIARELTRFLRKGSDPCQ